MANLGAGAIYSVPFTASVSTAGSVDLLGVLAPSNSQVVLRSLTIGAVTAAGTQASELEIDIFRGSTAPSTGATITPVQILPSTSPAPSVAGSSVTGPSAVLVSTASATLEHRDSWAYAFQSYVYPPNPSDFTFLARARPRSHPSRVRRPITFLIRAAISGWPSARSKANFRANGSDASRSPISISTS